jgi:CRP-like cAMP-binding protein
MTVLPAGAGFSAIRTDGCISTLGPQFACITQQRYATVPPVDGFSMKPEASFLYQFVVGNLTYVLLIISMLMTRMLWLRIFAIAAGVVGSIYTWFWLNDAISTTWEIIFVAVNVGQIGLASYRNAFMKFDPEERMFYQLMVPSLEPHQVRRLLKIGEWRRAEPGTHMIAQGTPASHLIFIKSGQAQIRHENTPVATCGAGSLLGELSVATGDPATATAVAIEPIQYLAFEKMALRKLKKSDPMIAQAIDNCSRENLRAKLVGMNVAVADGGVLPRQAETKIYDEQARSHL